MLNSIIAPVDNTVAGLPIIDLKPGDPLPANGISWNAVYIDPALATDLYVRNHRNNRNIREQRLEMLVSDLKDGRWRLTPAPLVFDSNGVLIDGQNRLLAAKKAGVGLWTVVTFGWDEETMHFLDLGAKRTGGDMLRIGDVKSGNLVSSTISRHFRYKEALASGKRMSHSVISVPAVEAEFNLDPAFWVHAAHIGNDAWQGLRRGLNPTLFALIAALIEEVNPNTAETFFLEVVGSPTPGTPAWAIKDRYHAARYTPREFIDRRVPIEFLIRAYNAWAGTEKKFRGYPAAGFSLSRVLPIKP